MGHTLGYINYFSSLGQSLKNPKVTGAAIIQSIADDPWAALIRSPLNPVSPFIRANDIINAHRDAFREAGFFGLGYLHGGYSGQATVVLVNYGVGKAVAGATVPPTASMQQPPPPPPKASVASNPAVRTPQQAGISRSDAIRIQNAANRTGQEIYVVGSRAKGTAAPISDWDYVMSGKSAQRHSASGSVPRGTSGGAINSTGRETGIDIFTNNPRSPQFQPLDPTRPHVPFLPR